MSKRKFIAAAVAASIAFGQEKERGDTMAGCQDMMGGLRPNGQWRRPADER